jgi:hypothetical protein
MKKVYIIIVILAVGAGILLWANSKKQGQLAGKQQEKYEVKMPDNFPKDFPIDVTATLASAEKPEEGVLEFKTNLLPPQAFAAYTEYFSKNKWEILLKNSNPVVSSLNVKNTAGDTMSVVMRLGNDGKTLVTVVLNKKK